MKHFFKSDIKLQEAMTIPLEQNIRGWFVLGQLIDCPVIPKDVIVHATSVCSKANIYSIFILWTKSCDKNVHFDSIANFSSLDELCNKYPQLVEMKGDLFALN